MMNVSLNIGQTEIKVLAVNGQTVKAWHSRSLPAGSVRDGLILAPEAVGQEINTLFKEALIIY